jgi:hypothetical protein
MVRLAMDLIFGGLLIAALVVTFALAPIVTRRVEANRLKEDARGILSIIIRANLSQSRARVRVFVRVEGNDPKIYCAISMGCKESMAEPEGFEPSVRVYAHTPV